jgi:structural maintenance of chromosome 4
VVGPNGSGKSNLLESLIFIFGHRASRMRLKKLSELIHNSNDHPSCSFASVTVNFYELNHKGEKVNHFSIKRTVFKENSTTKYFINTTESKKDEVVELLMSKGVDLVNNRFMILQGEVEQIAAMEPKGKNEDNPGLLEYLEEIIGSNADVKKIEEYADQLEQLMILKNERHTIYDDSKKSLESLSQYKD